MLNNICLWLRVKGNRPILEEVHINILTTSLNTFLNNRSLCGLLIVQSLVHCQIQ